MLSRAMSHKHTAKESQKTAFDLTHKVWKKPAED